MHKIKIPGMALLLLATSALAPPLCAQSRVDEHHALARGGRVELENIAGKVSVRGWDRDEVALTGQLGEGQRIDVNASKDRVQLRVIYPRDGRNGDGAVLELRVPRNAELSATTVSASMDIAEVDLARLQARTVSGGLTAGGRAGEAQLNTVSGGIQSRLATGRLRGNTVSGRLSATAGASGDVVAETVSGRIDLAAGAVSRLRAESVSGSINVSTSGLTPGGSIALQTVSGSIDLALPRDASALLNVETFSGDIQSDAGQVKRPQYGPGQSLDAKLGGGNGDVSVESHSGAVRVRQGG